MKKQKKGKAESSSSRRAPRKASAQTSPQFLHITSSAPAPRSRILMHPRRPELPLSDAAAKCQQLYVTYTSDSSGRIQLDRERLAHALAEAGIGALAEQALYSLALMSAADGHSALFEADVIAALERATAMATQKAS
jgi:hypothetical protein